MASLYLFQFSGIFVVCAWKYKRFLSRIFFFRSLFSHRRCCFPLSIRDGPRLEIKFSMLYLNNFQFSSTVIVSRVGKLLFTNTAQSSLILFQLPVSPCKAICFPRLFLIYGGTISESTTTIWWSDMPDIVSWHLTKLGLLVKYRSSMLCSRVGVRCNRVNPLLLARSMSASHNVGWLHLSVSTCGSQTIPLALKSPPNIIVFPLVLKALCNTWFSSSNGDDVTTRAVCRSFLQSGLWTFSRKVLPKLVRCFLPMLLCLCWGTCNTAL